jgi:polysaccharide biosynthesis protein PelA
VKQPIGGAVRGIQESSTLGRLVRGGGAARAPRPRPGRSALALAALLAVGRAAARSAPSVAFFYGRPLPVAELSCFDWAVVEPDNVAPGDLDALHRAGVSVFAYVSLGETASAPLDSTWVLGRNEAWESVIVDPASPAWRERVLGRADLLWRRGYRGLFLDTLDSYARVRRGEEERRAARRAMAELVLAIHRQHPDVRLFLNRGFEILDEVGHLASGIAAESLFFGWDAGGRRYVEVPPADREWLAGRLRSAARQLGIPVVIVDYLPPSRRDEAREAARRIESMGFVPWISTPGLDVIGVGALSPGDGGRRTSRAGTEGD